MCKKYFENTSSVHFDNSITNLNFQQYSTIILDITSQEDRCSFVFECEKSLLEKIIFLIPKNLKMNLQEKIRAKSKNVMAYPCNYEIFSEVLGQYFSNIFESKQTESKNSCSDDVKDLMGFFVGDSAEIRKIRQEILDAAKLKTPVLLLGETGTGKTTAAKLIHHYSERQQNPFISINLATIVDSLAESIFFGTCKGVYTDAIPQDGLVKTADTGTLFFDEADCALKNTQSVLLTFVETLKMQKVGSKKIEKVDTRLIFATNSNMKKLLAEGSFRNDLFFRIADNVITFPSLRERIEDIPCIVEAYLRSSKIKITPETIKLLQSYDWPGNIRELHKCLARAIRTCKDNIIQVSDIDFGLFGRI